MNNFCKVCSYYHNFLFKKGNKLFTMINIL